MGSMPWRLAADTVLVVHLGFVLFVVLGGFLVIRWPKIAFAHLPVVVYAVAIELVGFTCPLTPLENNLRARADSGGYDGGFVEHYVTSVLYPGELTPTVKLLLSLAVLAAASLAYGWWLVRRSAA